MYALTCSGACSKPRGASYPGLVPTLRRRPRTGVHTQRELVVLRIAVAEEPTTILHGHSRSSRPGRAWDSRRRSAPEGNTLLAPARPILLPCHRWGSLDETAALGVIRQPLRAPAECFRDLGALRPGACYGDGSGERISVLRRFVRIRVLSREIAEIKVRSPCLSLVLVRPRCCARKLSRRRPRPLPGPPRRAGRHAPPRESSTRTASSRGPSTRCR